MENNEQRTENPQRDRRPTPPPLLPLQICVPIFTHETVTLFPRGERANQRRFCGQTP
jgi:hypothetical protein